MNIERLEELVKSFGVSSAESIVRSVIETNYDDLGYALKKDHLGSIFAYKPSKNKDAKTLMIACPLDEVGLMVSEVHDDGLLSFITLESIALNSLLNQRVSILTRKDELIYGVIKSKKKVMEDKCDIKNSDELFIECSIKADEVKQRILPGDLVSYAANFSCYDDVVISKAASIRAINELTISLLTRIKDEEFDFNLAIGCIAQSTVGYRGTKTATYVIEPDMAIALCGFDSASKLANLYDGTIVGYYDKQMLPSKYLLNDVVSKLSPKSYFGLSGNDGSFIHKTLAGTPCVSMGMAVSNMGSANEMVAISDLKQLEDDLYRYLHMIDSTLITHMGFGDLHG